jgi:RNA polymerase sigma-70 factor (ECF subfamily)
MTDARPALDPADWTTHVEFVRRLARSLVADRADADDLEQEAWLAWMRSPPDHVGASRGWLARVVANLARMGARSRTRREQRERIVVARGPRHAAAADDSVAQIELHRRVVERVLALAEPYRAVVVLRFFEQRSLAEIAQRLALPLETVKTRQKRALGQLREELLGSDGAERDQKHRALVMLAQGTGVLVMTSGTKWAVVTAAAIVIACFAARPWLWPNAAIAPLHVAAADGTAIADAEEAPLAPPVAAVRDASPLPEDAPPAAPAPTSRRAAVESRIHGDVHDAADRPLPGRRVELYERRDNHDARDQSLVASTLADAQGRFDFGPTSFERRATATVIAFDSAASVGKAIVPSQSSAVHLVIGATKSLIGRVVDLRGNAVADAKLFACMRFREGRHDDGYFVPESLAPQATTRSAADGAFAFDELPCRWSVTLEVTREGFASYRESFHLDDSPRDHEATIVLRPECRIEGVVTLADGTPSCRTATVSASATAGATARPTWRGATGSTGSKRARGTSSSRSTRNCSRSGALRRRSRSC